jgi:hypothetical protein
MALLVDGATNRTGARRLRRFTVEHPLEMVPHWASGR